MKKECCTFLITAFVITMIVSAVIIVTLSAADYISLEDLVRFTDAYTD